MMTSVSTFELGLKDLASYQEIATFDYSLLIHTPEETVGFVVFSSLVHQDLQKVAFAIERETTELCNLVRYCI
jgi:hypothetical protein